MRFLRLPDPLLSVLFEDDDILAIDKPYGFNTHTNDSKIDHSEFIQDGLIEIFEKQLGKKLYIIHRLDQTTSGVVIFGKTPEGAKKYAEFFFDRLVKKTYWFITASKSAQPSFVIDQQIIHKAKELEAKTNLKFLKKSKNFELWQANPLTGRNHQIRIHAKAAEIPILGDDKYGGARFTFLCLHNHRIEFPNQIVIESKPPVYFDNPDLLDDVFLAKTLFEADRRGRLFSFSKVADQCFRLVHTKSDSKDSDFSIDQYGKNIVLNWNRETWRDLEMNRFSAFAKLMNKPLIVRLPKTKKESENTWIAHEDKIAYEMKDDGGLSLNQRLQRNWVLTHAVGKSVLSLFSSNCSYGLAAALGQSTQVTSVDSNKNVLNWGRKNFELNNLDPQQSKFLMRDSLVFLKQALSKNLKYDLIICDAPTFFRGEKGVFKIENDLEVLLKSCLGCLGEKGELLFSTTFDGFFIDDLRKAILKVQKEMKITDLEINCLLPSMDFELPDEKANLKSFLIRLG